MARYIMTTFLSAFLLFQMQPLIGKYILPWFGGGPAVWTTCMLFFQALLLVGYGATHVLSSRLSQCAHGWVHLALLGSSLAFLPIAPAPDVWKPSGEASPTPYILHMLLVNVGVPYLLLASTSPLLQRWFSASYPLRSPYRLYALSNAGSLLALLSYPFLVEPLLTLNQQMFAWSISFIAFVGLSGWCALRMCFPEEAAVAPDGRGLLQAMPNSDVAPDPSPPDRSPPNPSRPNPSRPGAGRGDAPGPLTVVLWLLLAAFGSIMLLATTNQLCQEVAVVPFLWILPLSIYLLTFIVCFDSDRWYDRRFFGSRLALAAPWACYALFEGVSVPMWLQIAIYSAVLFVCCMNCHGELARSKPSPRYLTLFYLVVAAGGAAGGVFAAVVAPSIFNDYWEYHVALAGTFVLTAISWWRHRVWAGYLRRPSWLFAPAAIGIAALIAVLAIQTLEDEKDAICTSRTFYGVLRVTEYGKKGDPSAVRSLMHGRILHGNQYVDGERRYWATTYYGPESGIGLALAYHPRRANPDDSQRDLRVGVIGLGTGTIAAWGRPGDYIRFYEINPAVVRISNDYFTYREDSAAGVDVVLGDARIQLERELASGEPGRFDVLAVDAFTSDAIPVHLLTVECAGIYWRHLKPDGLLLLHISNRFLNLNPVTRGLAEQFGSTAVLIDSSEDEDRNVDQAAWVILTNNEEFLSSANVEDAISPWPESDPPPIVWTDSFASLWQVLEI